MYKVICNSLFLLSLVFIIACNQENITDPENILDKNELNIEVDFIKYQQIDSERTKGKGVSDPFTIKKVERIEDNLFITVSYIGGKKEHAFNILWNGQVLFSYPPVVNFILSHSSNKDDGNQTLTQKLAINLKAIFGKNEYSEFMFNIFSILNSTSEPDIPFHNSIQSKNTFSDIPGKYQYTGYDLEGNVISTGVIEIVITNNEISGSKDLSGNNGESGKGEITGNILDENANISINLNPNSIYQFLLKGRLHQNIRGLIIGDRYSDTGTTMSYRKQGTFKAEKK